EDDSYQIKKPVRALTVFGEHDLGGRAPFPNTDLVLCRNVLIYFTPELQQRTLKLFAYSLRDRGYLVLGKAESTGQVPEYFAPEQKPLKVFRRSGDRILIPPQNPTHARPAPLPRLGLARHHVVPQPTGVAGVIVGGQSALRARLPQESLVLKLPVGVVIVDRHYDIQVINTVARRALGIYSSAIGEDLIHTSQGIQREQLREAIDT